MKRIVILGTGTAGTIMANQLSRKINHKNWIITIIDEHEYHYYQPGFLFIPFGYYTEKDVVRNKQKFLPKAAEFLQETVELIIPGSNAIKLKSGKSISYNILIIATGAKIVPAEVEGLTDSGWDENIFDFYTLEGSIALAKKLKNWTGGRLVIHIAEMPIKCPVAPLEFSFLADAFFMKKGIREQVDITFITPLSGAFTKPKASEVLGHLLAKKNINLITDFDVERVNGSSNQIVSYDKRKVDFDLLVSVPTNMGDSVIERSGLGDDLNFIPTQKHNLQSKKYENIFVIGDATDLPSSKAGSVAHFQAETLTKNVINFIDHKPLLDEFDGHANCFIESGFGKGFLIDFNYDTEPLEGRFPIPILGPMTLLGESKSNHWGKLAFKWIYWSVLLKGLPLPGISAQMSKAGKK